MCKWKVWNSPGYKTITKQMDASQKHQIHSSKRNTTVHSFRFTPDFNNTTSYHTSYYLLVFILFIISITLISTYYFIIIYYHADMTFRAESWKFSGILRSVPSSHWKLFDGDASTPAESTWFPLFLHQQSSSGLFACRRAGFLKH